MLFSLSNIIIIEVTITVRHLELLCKENSHSAVCYCFFVCFEDIYNDHMIWCMLFLYHVPAGSCLNLEYSVSCGLVWKICVNAWYGMNSRWMHFNFHILFLWYLFHFLFLFFAYFIRRLLKISAIFCKSCLKDFFWNGACIGCFFSFKL